MMQYMARYDARQVYIGSNTWQGRKHRKTTQEHDNMLNQVGCKTSLYMMQNMARQEALKNNTSQQV